MENEGQISCVSCGRTLIGPSGQGVYYWGHSHNLPVKPYPEFEDDPENFKPRCQNWEGKQGCHEKLDNCQFEDIIKFKDFEQLMEYRRKNTPLAYNQWVTCLNSLGINPGYHYESIE